MATAPTAPGIIAILIGLLLPAVQKITDGTSNTLLFGESLRSGGKVFVAMCDGSVRNLYNPKETMPNGLIGLL